MSGSPVGEILAAGQRAGSVDGSDVENAVLQYSIIGGNHDGAFRIDTNGSVWTTAPLDFEVGPIRVLNIRVSDGAQSVDVDLVISITDVDEAPIATVLNVPPIMENLAAGESAGSIAASDPEGNSLTYTFTSGNADGAFVLSASGDVSTSRPLDFETDGSTRLLTVTVSDGVNTVPVVITVTVRDTNELPTATANPVAGVVENAAPGQIAGAVVASDPEGTTLTYTIVGGNHDAGFVISSGGVVTTTKSFDHEVSAVRLLNLVVSDGVNAVQVDLTIAITNVDETPAAALPQTASVDEGAPVVTIDLSALHPDPEGLTVTIATGSLTANNAAALTTNGATITYTHDGSETSTDTISYSAADPAGNTVSNTITVTINTQNDAPTITPKAGVVIEENLPAGEYAQLITTTDPDGPSPATLSIIGGNVGNAFTIFGNQLKTTGPLDAETTVAYDIIVQATDGTDTSTETFHVDVTSVNEAPVVSVMADQQTAVRAPVSISVPVSDPDVGDGVSNISVTGLPPGLSSSYNQVSRTVEIVGSVTNEAYASTTVTISVMVTDDGIPPLDSPSRTFDLVFADIIISPHAGSIQITEVRYAESEKYNPAAPFDALIMDEFIEFTNFGPAHDIEDFWLSDTKYPAGLDDLDYHGTGTISPDETGRIYQGFTQPTAFATNQVISSPIRRPTSTTYELDDGSSRASATYDFFGTAFGFPAGPNSLWEAFNDSGDDIWFWDDQNRLVAFVAWDDGTGNDHIRERPDPGWGIWDPADELRLSGAAPGQSISLAGPTGDSTCWELTGSGSATCVGSFTSTNRDAGNTNPTGRVSSQGRVN